MAEETKVSSARYDISLLTDDDLYLYNEGTHYRIYDKLGAHPATVDGQEGAYFAVWAPNARQVTVIGDFNGWNKTSHYLHSRKSSGVWECFVPGVRSGALYKYHVISKFDGYCADKADPVAFAQEKPPRTASIVRRLEYRWGDEKWMAERHARNSRSAPMSIYELHLGSWMRKPEEGRRPLNYRELAPTLASYVSRMGFTHVELLPIMEHPFYPSWGYQTTGYFAPSSFYGAPEDFMFFVDHLHRNGIGVILDWVPSHFPCDEYGPGFFDGTHLYEHADPRQGLHPDWSSFIFNYGRAEVRSFLISSALFWLERYHVDGLRVDAVASMLYLDYSRRNSDWIRNQYGGNENLEALAFIRRLNQEVYTQHPDVQMIAEESTAWAMVSRPAYVGGLGFGFKWDMGWMHDTLVYMCRDTVHRKYHQNDLTFRMLYAFTENFILPLSHDEVVHGKGSLLSKMPGDDWQKFANLRLLLGYMFAQPGKKLLFMGGEFGQWREWSHNESLDWHLLDYPAHAGVQQWVHALNHMYATEPALHELDCEPATFDLIDCNDWQQSIISFARRGHSPRDLIIAVFNFTPVPRHDYRIGAPRAGLWRRMLNSDARDFGGTAFYDFEVVRTTVTPWHGRSDSISVSLPPLSVLFLKWEG